MGGRAVKGEGWAVWASIASGVWCRAMLQKKKVKKKVFLFVFKLSGKQF